MRAIIVLAVSLLIACEDKPPARTVFDAQTQAVDKAKKVEGQLQQGSEKRDEQVQQIQGY